MCSCQPVLEKKLKTCAKQFVYVESRFTPQGRPIFMHTRHIEKRFRNCYFTWLNWLSNDLLASEASEGIHRYFRTAKIVAEGIMPI